MAILNLMFISLITEINYVLTYELPPSCDKCNQLLKVQHLINGDKYPEFNIVFIVLDEFHNINKLGEILSVIQIN